mmetsp:Transcript_73904/g.210897  ORF Transcript_73904/g.210897 Transcript_73904/m.210897 type:complete len:240 (+) Transcript_73904:632-1351(+)
MVHDKPPKATGGDARDRQDHELPSKRNALHGGRGPWRQVGHRLRRGDRADHRVVHRLCGVSWAGWSVPLPAVRDDIGEYNAPSRPRADRRAVQCQRRWHRRGEPRRADGRHHRPSEGGGRGHILRRPQRDPHHGDHDRSSQWDGASRVGQRRVSLCVLGRGVRGRHAGRTLYRQLPRRGPIRPLRGAHQNEKGAFGGPPRPVGVASGNRRAARVRGRGVFICQQPCRIAKVRRAHAGRG